MANEQDFPPPLPPTFPRQSSKSSVPVIVLGCAGALLVVLLACGVFVGILYAGNKKADPVVDAYLALVSQGKFDEAYATLHPKFHEAVSLERYRQIQTGLTETLGNYKSKSIRGININTLNGVTTTVATYAMTFEKGQTTAVFTLIGDKIARFDIDSPLLRDLKCPHCGVALTDFGNFCPNCGKPLQEEPKAESESQASAVSNESP